MPTLSTTPSTPRQDTGCATVCWPTEALGQPTAFCHSFCLEWGTCRPRVSCADCTPQCLPTLDQTSTPCVILPSCPWNDALASIACEELPPPLCCCHHTPGSSPPPHTQVHTRTRVCIHIHFLTPVKKAQRKSISGWIHLNHMCVFVCVGSTSTIACPEL